MRIDTPGKDGETISKEVVVGGGVRVKVEGSHFRVTGEVLQVNDVEAQVFVKGEDFEGWVNKENIVDAMDPGTYALDHAINVTAWKYPAKGDTSM